MSNVISFTHFRNQKQQLVSYKDWYRQGYIDFAELNFDKKITLASDGDFKYEIPLEEIPVDPSNETQAENYSKGIDTRFNEIIQNYEILGDTDTYFYELGRKAADSYTVTVKLSTGHVFESERMLTNLKTWQDSEGVWNAKWELVGDQFNAPFKRGVQEYLDNLQSNEQVKETVTNVVKLKSINNVKTFQTVSTDDDEPINWFSAGLLLAVGLFSWYFLWVVVVK
jgi:hypothetical protein